MVCRPTAMSSVYFYLNHPTAVCIQETLLHSNKTASFKNYSYDGISAMENNSSLHGGVAILIKNSTPY